MAEIYLRIYYCLSKKISLCLNCYQDFLVHEHVIEIENPDNAIQVIRKIDRWISLIKDHGVQYKIESIYNDYFIEIKNYEDKLYSIKEKLKHPINRDIFLWNTLIKLEALNILKSLDSSKAMSDYKDHLAHLSFNEKFNKKVSY